MDHENLNYTGSGNLARNGDGQFITRMVRMSWIFLGICSAFQIIFFWSIENIISIGAVILGWIIITKIFLQLSMLERFPLSTFLVIAFGSTQLYLPLLFTTIENKSLITNLELPEEVFLHTILGITVVTLAHAFYRLLSRTSTRRSFSLLTKAGFFDPPKDIQLWLMGFIGLGASLYVFFVNPDVGTGVTSGSSLDKIVQGLVPFSYAPYFIPFGKLYGNDEPRSKRIVMFLAIFTLLLFVISIGRNSRGAFMFGFTSLGFSYALALLLGIFKTKLITLKNVAIAGSLVWLLTGPVADLGTAMVIVRGERDVVDAVELIELTFETYGDKDAIRNRREEDKTVSVDTDWDERYLDNIFTARFANLKFNDMSLIVASKLRKYDPDMLDYSLDYVLSSSLPDPFLKALNIDADKDVILSHSIGDFLFLVAGGYGFDTGFRTGHFAGTGMATFGWWYLLLLGLGMIPVFLLFDKFCRRNPKLSDDQPINQRLQFSFCGILSISTIFQFLPNESIIVIASFLIRGWIQLVILYFLMFHITRILSSFVRNSRSVRFKFS